MKLYVIILAKKNKSLRKEENRALWIGFEKNYQAAGGKAKELYPDKDPVFFGEMSFLELIYLLPFFNKRQK